MKLIKLNTKEELNIYMNPVRQQLLRHLNINNTPMTPKMLADKLSISASGVQHHIRKLMSLGVIELDHQELINGITASFYKPALVTVQIGLEVEDDTSVERDVHLQNSLANVYEGFRTQLKRRIKEQGKPEEENINDWGDILTGVVYLKKEESKELLQLINTYIEQHSIRSEDVIPWEYAVVVYNAEEVEEKKKATVDKKVKNTNKKGKKDE
jgi:hypothetical protein